MNTAINPWKTGPGFAGGSGASPVGTAEEWKRYPNLQTITAATTTEIRSSSIVYLDSNGTPHTLCCDDVILSGGVQRNSGEALRYASAAPDFYMIGDCSEFGGDLRRGGREAWAVACQI